MIALDTSFLVDYLDGTDAAGRFVERRRETPFHAPTLSLFEAYRGGARTGGPPGVQRVHDALEWVQPLALDGPATNEAAMVEAELLEDGIPVNLGDVLIAGVCRHHGATLVTRDDHFERVDGLDVLHYE